MKNPEWWRSTANHMWRIYFNLQNNGFNWDNLSLSYRKIFAVCNHVFLKKCPAIDQNILRFYFSTRWGDDIYAVEDYSAKNNIPVKVIWMVIRRANRTLMEEIGLLDRKDDFSNVR